MNTTQWRGFLQQWSEDILNSTLAQRASYLITPEMVSTRWLGYAGATEQQIIHMEARLKTELPVSYRTFLLTTNGWSVLTQRIGLLWDTENVEWLQECEPRFVQIWSEDEDIVPDEEYFVYSDKQDPTSIRGIYIRTGLQISNPDYLDGEFYMLNPQIVTPEGEWEAWSFASWRPGAIRYRSFWELMQGEYQDFQALEEV